MCACVRACMEDMPKAHLTCGWCVCCLTQARAVFSMLQAGACKQAARHGTPARAGPPTFLLRAHTHTHTRTHPRPRTIYLSVLL